MLDANISNMTELKYPDTYPSRRSNLVASNGMVATSQPLAAQAGLRMLIAGGNAVDAAVAAALALTVVEPRSTHLGGDAFAIVGFPDGTTAGMNGSGRTPAAMDAELLRSKGHTDHVPTEGPLSITVPGQLHALEELATKYGKLGFDTLLQPAIDYATNGYPVAEESAIRWREAVDKLNHYSGGNSMWLIDGRAPRPGEMFKVPTYGKFLKNIAEHGSTIFYQGDLGEQYCASIQKQGGVLEASDLRGHTTDWVGTESVAYRGLRVHELPVNTQGIIPLVTLAALNEYDLSEFSAHDQKHLIAEALKLGLEQCVPHISDPDYTTWDRSILQQGKELAGKISPDSAAARSGFMPPGADTVYVSAADSDGMMVSLITSVFDGFGSGVVDEHTGVVAQNRAANFSLNPNSPNYVAPGKRSYHTIIPALATNDDGPVIGFGVVGAMMQPQGQVQILSNLLDRGLSPQQSLDAPRIRVSNDGGIKVEGEQNELADALEQKGHQIYRNTPISQFGGAQMVVRQGDVYVGATDGRKDGGVAGY